MTLRRRVAKLETVRRPQADLDAHWQRVWARDADGFDRLLAALPDSHAERVLTALGGAEAIAQRLFVRGPTWAGPGAPAIARWAWQHATWGDDHPHRSPLPTPIPAGFLDLLLDHPDAEVSANQCGGCRVCVPSSPALRVESSPASYVPPWPLTDTCPVCGAIVPPPHLC